MSIALKLALRQLWKFRSTNAVIIATLAATVGALLAVLAIANNLLVNPWTYDTQRLGVLQHRTAASDQLSYSFSAQEYRAIEAAGVFARVNVGTGAPAVVLGNDGLARQVRLVRTLPAAAAVTGAAPLLGRFIEERDIGLAEPGVVISHDLWQSLFNARRDAIGQAINLNGSRVEVIGVMPERYHYLGGDVWSGLPTRIATETGTDRQYIVNFILHERGGLDTALSRLATLAQQLAAQGSADRYPSGWSIVGELVIDAVMGPMKPALFLVIGATALMLLIGVINVMTLLMSRHMAAEGEATVRVALGAPFSSLVTLAFAQNLLLSLCGAAAGWGVGAWLFRALVALISIEWVPRELEGHFRYAGASWWWIPLLAVAIAVALTAVQVLRLRRLDPGAVVREGVRSGDRRGAKFARRTLVAGQIAAAAFVGLLAVAIGTSAHALSQQSPGFAPERVLTTRVVLSADRYTDALARSGYFDRLLASLREQPQVESVAVIDAAPFQRVVRSGTVSGAAIDSSQALPVDYHAVHGDLADALRPQLLEGRLPSAEDRADTSAIVVVTRGLAERLGRTGSVLGQTLLVRGQAGEAVQRTIVGVVADVRHDSPLATPRPGVYLPYAQDNATGDGLPPRSMDLLVRLRAGASVPDGFLQRAVAAVDPMVPTLEVAFLRDRGQAAMAGVTLAQRLFSMFALIAVVLAVLGCHVMLRLALQLRRREFAIRSALGASPARLFRAVMSEGVTVAAIGAGVGAALAAVGIRVVNATLQDVAELSFLHVASVLAALLVIGALASLWSAFAAATTQPQHVLRSA